MKASSLTVATSVVVLVLATHEPTLSSGLSVGEGGHYASSRRHVMTAHPLSMQSSKFLHWQKKPLPEYFSQMSSWEEQQREQHPVNSSELWGPFSYSEEEERALERHLAVEESEWNAKHGGIGGRPRPRYCVIDEEWRGSTHADQDFSPEGFRRALRAALNLGRLSDFLVCDRYQEPRGHDVLTGKPLAMNLTSSYSCPALRTYTRAGEQSPLHAGLHMLAIIPNSSPLSRLCPLVCLWSGVRPMDVPYFIGSRLGLLHGEVDGAAEWAAEDGHALQRCADDAFRHKQPDGTIQS
eukprot:scaffold207_cov409-Prasinococcus_capsulatus_cf.AAC.34